jgi:hypothetical protein
MRSYLSIVFFIYSLFNYSQVQKIKIQKEDSLSPYVTLCGKKSGEISLTALCSDNKFKIINNTKEYKVDFAIAGFQTSTGSYVEWVISSDSLNKRIIQELLKPKAPSKTKMMISNISAKNKSGEEIKLNDIILNINK